MSSKTPFKFLFMLLFFFSLVAACTKQYKITSGEEAFELKQYPLAIDLLQKEIDASKVKENKAFKSFLIGKSYEQVLDYKSAIPFFQNAAKLGFGRKALESYANALMQDYQYKNAQNIYRKLVKDYGTSEQWDLALKSCAFALNEIKSQNKGEFQVSTHQVNSAVEEYAPFITEDGSLFYTSDRSASKGKSYSWTGRAFSDVYTNSKDPNWIELLAQVNTEFNEANLILNTNGNHAIFTRCGAELDADNKNEYCKLYEITKSARGWGEATVLPFCKSNKSNYSGAAFFNKDQGIIYTANSIADPKTYDLFLVYKRGKEWLKPEALPKNINSNGNEKFPVVHGDSLFYSSDGKVGLGGLDIYFTKWISANNWSNPRNIGLPYNSGGDDMSFFPLKQLSKGNNQVSSALIVSNRKNSLGLDDLFYIDKFNIKTDTNQISKSIKIKIIGTVSEATFTETNNPNSKQIGTQIIPDALVQISPNPLNTISDKKTNKKGAYEFNVSQENLYTLSASKSGYFTKKKNVRVQLDPNSEGEETYIAHIILDKIYYNQEIVLKDIFYDFNKWDIRQDAKPSLDSLTELLRTNPSIVIELSSHTDCRGGDIFNSELSQRRAQSAVNYIRTKGISSKRIKPAGYGESRPAVDCECSDCSEAQHQLNRRTSFMILESD